jgi:hypothetical protein
MIMDNDAQDKLHWVLVAGLLLLGGVAFFCAILMMMVSLFDPADDSYQIVPLLLGLMMAAAGCAVLVALRRRWGIPWVPLLVTLVLFGMGMAMVAFGGTAVFLYDEPNEFLPNLGWAVTLCLTPGMVLIGLGLLLYGYEARRRQKKSVGTDFSSFPDPADWIQTLKDDEKSGEG